jgi:hypothetical protein
MTTIETRIYNADRAKEVLDNEAFQAAFSDIEKEVIEQWTNSPARDQDGRERLWVYLSLLRKVKAHLSTSVETGKLARLDLDHKQSKAQQLGALWSKL